MYIIFNKLKYTFHYMIKTDGANCSILIFKNDLISKKLPYNKIGSNTNYSSINISVITAYLCKFINL